MTASIWSPNGFSPEIVPTESFEFTATAGQTTFSIAPYTAITQDQLQVFKGSTSVSAQILRNTQWSVVGTNIVLTSGAAAGEYVRVTVFLENPTPNSDLPSQTGNAGKFLSTTGSTPVWANVPAELPAQTGNAGKFLTTDGNTPSWADGSGSGGNFQQGGTGAIVRTMQNKVREFVSVTDFGASPAATAAVNSAAFADATTYAIAQGKSLFIPAGNYKLASQWTITAQLHAFGEGRERSLVTYDGATLGGANGVIQIIPPALPANSNRFYKFHDFGIQPGTGQCTNGLRVVLNSGAYFSNFDFEHLYIGDFTSYGMCLDNTVANADGFFTGRVSRCWITNGFQGIKIGDSVFVEHNTITIGTLTRTMAGVLVTGLAGARNCSISHNNITCAGGAIVMIDCEQYLIQNNQCEHPFYYGVNYLGTYNAFIYGYNIKWNTFIGNTFQTGAASIVGPAYTVLLEGTTNYCKFNSFERCKFFKGETAHVNFGVGAVFNCASEQKNTWDVQAVYSIADATYPNYEVDLPLALVNGWTTNALSDPPTIYFEENGWASVRGIVSNASPSAPGDGSIATLPLLVNVKNSRHRFVTQTNASDSSNAVIQAYSGKIWAVTAPVTANTGLDGVRFRFQLTVPE